MGLGDACGEPDEAQEVGGFLFVAGGDAATLLDPAKEAFNHVAMFVPFTVVAFPAPASGIGFDTRSGLHLADQ